jgi:hypothetical protein
MIDLAIAFSCGVLVGGLAVAAWSMRDELAKRREMESADWDGLE